MLANRKIQLLFSFGAHCTKKDWDQAKAAAEKFKPHVYAAEESEGDGRCLLIKKTNAELEEARRNDAKKEELLRTTYLLTPQHLRVFTTEQQRFLIETEGLVYYTFEDNSGELFFARKDRYGELDFRAKHSLLNGKVDIAVEQLFECHKLFAEEMEERNLKVALNSLSNIDTLEFLFPKLVDANPLRIFIRLGSLHTGTYCKAAEFAVAFSNVELSWVFDEGLPYRYDIFDWPIRAMIYQKPVNAAWLLYGFLWKIWPENWEEFHAVAEKLPEDTLREIFAKNTLGEASKNLACWAEKIVTEVKKVIGSKQSQGSTA